MSNHIKQDQENPNAKEWQQPDTYIKDIDKAREMARVRDEYEKIIADNKRRLRTPSPPKGVYEPEGWEDGTLSYLEEVQKQTGISLNMSDKKLRQKVIDWRDKVGEIAVQKGIYVFPFVIPKGITLDQNIAISDSFKPKELRNAYPEWLRDTYVYDSLRADNDKDSLIHPEFNMINGRLYDRNNILLAMKGAVMTDGNFESMVQGIGNFQCYDGKDCSLEPYSDHIYNYIKGDRTQVDDMRSLQKDQYVADPQTAFAIDGLRRAIRSTGSKDVPGKPFNGLHILTPIIIDAENNGRIKDADGDWVVPTVGAHNFGFSGISSQSVLGSSSGGISGGWVAIDEMKE